MSMLAFVVMTATITLASRSVCMKHRHLRQCNQYQFEHARTLFVCNYSKQALPCQWTGCKRLLFSLYDYLKICRQLLPGLIACQTGQPWFQQKYVPQSCLPGLVAGLQCLHIPECMLNARWPAQSIPFAQSTSVVPVWTRCLRSLSLQAHW